MPSHHGQRALVRLYNGTMTSPVHAADPDLLDGQAGSGDAVDPGADAAAEAREIGRILADGKLAYVAIGTARGPLVTPVLYGAAGGAIWVLTNHHALKARVWRKRPRAGWTVRSGNTAVAFTGEATMLSVRDVKAVLARPLGLVAVPPAVLSWACRNPRQVGGFVRDAIVHPTRGMPQDFVLVRLQPDSATIVRDLDDATAVQDADPRFAAVVPDGLAELTTQRTGILGLTTPDGPVAIPAGWDHEQSVIRLSAAAAHLVVGAGTEGCMTFDEPVHLRPTEQRGIVLRGQVNPVAGDDSGSLAFAADRVTYWDGFTVETVDIPG